MFVLESFITGKCHPIGLKPNRVTENIEMGFRPLVNNSGVIGECLLFKPQTVAVGKEKHNSALLQRVRDQYLDVQQGTRDKHRKDVLRPHV
jgi:hypothetical protein